MLTRHIAERDALDLHAKLGAPKRLLRSNLRQVGLGNPELASKALGGAAAAGANECGEVHADSLLPTLPKGQVFDLIAKTYQTDLVDIAQTRRERLKAWFAGRSIPSKEKSYISQLVRDKAPFGEKAARRLEVSYGMPAMYLDTPDSEAEAKAPEDMAELIELWPYLLPEQRRKIIDEIRPLAEHNRHIIEVLAQGARIVQTRPRRGARTHAAPPAHEEEDKSSPTDQ